MQTLRFIAVGLIQALGLVLITACPGEHSLPSQCAETVSVNGRVVDYESCFFVADSTQRCQPVKGATVSVLGQPDLKSQPTADNGAFSVRDVPRNTTAFLLVSPPSGSGDLLSTLQGQATNIGTDNISSIDLYMLKQTGLYAKMVSELGMSVTSHALYLGLVTTGPVSQGATAVAGAQIDVSPAADVVFVKALPLLDPKAQKYFYDPNATVEKSNTSTNGQFLVAAPANGTSTERSYGVLVTKPDAKNTDHFDPALVPLATGRIALGFHYPIITSSTSSVVDARIGANDGARSD
jgi:hypothetical protein